jgi:hypothetical protein
MMRKWIWLLVGGLVITSVAGCSPATSSPSSDTGIVPPSHTPTVQAAIYKATAEPTPTPKPSALETGTPPWTVVPISPAQVIEGKTMKNSTPIPTPSNQSLQKLVTQAKDDLAKRLNIATDQIDLIELQSVVWPDGSLGCPQPGMGYIQVQVDGLLIRLRVGGRIYEYHSGGNRLPFLCEQPAGSAPGENKVMPPPGSGSQ